MLGLGGSSVVVEEDSPGLLSGFSSVSEEEEDSGGVSDSLLSEEELSSEDCGCCDSVGGPGITGGFGLTIGGFGRAGFSLGTGTMRISVVRRSSVGDVSVLGFSFVFACIVPPFSIFASAKMRSARSLSVIVVPIAVGVLYFVVVGVE